MEMDENDGQVSALNRDLNRYKSQFNVVNGVQLNGNIPVWAPDDHGAKYPTFIMWDVECDPMILRVDLDGCISLPFKDWQYLMLDRDMIFDIYEAMTDALEMWERVEWSDDGEIISYGDEVDA